MMLSLRSFENARRRRIRRWLFLAAIVVVVLPAGWAEAASEIETLNKQISELYRAGKYADAVPIGQKALKLSETADGPESVATSVSANNLATVYQAAGDYAAAETLFQRALAIRERVSGPWDPNTAIGLDNLTILYGKMGKYAKAEPLCLRALAIREKAFGSQRPETARSLNSLATLYDNMGQYAKAEPLYQRALAIHEKAFGPQHPDTALSLNNLAFLYGEMGSYAKAEPLYRRALAIREKTLGPEHPDTVLSVNNLGALYCSMGEYGKAKPFYQRALAIREKALGPAHPDTALSLNNLAFLYVEMGEYPKAEPLYQRALAIREKTLGSEQPDTAASINNLALLFDKMGEYAKGEPLYRQALAIREKTLGPEHPDTAGSLNNLAFLYREMGEYAKAEPLFQRALTIREKTLGPEHPGTAQGLNNLALVYFEMADYAKAEPLYRRALTIREKAGAEHLDTAGSLNNLAFLYNKMGEFSKAEPLFQRALAIDEKMLGPEHPETALCINNLASLYSDQGDYVRAEPLYQRALQIREKMLGSQHPATAGSFNNLATLYWNKGDYTKAESFYQRALEIYEKAFGPVHPAVALGISNLAAICAKKGEYTKAEPLYLRALEIREKALGPEHPDTAMSLWNLALLNIDLGKPAEALELARRADNANTEILGNVLSFTSEDQRLAFQNTVNPYSILATLGQGPDIAEAVLRYKGVVLDSLLEDRLAAEASKNAAHREVIDKIRVAKRRLTQLLMETPKDFSEKAQKQRSLERETRAGEVERLESGLARDVAGLGNARRSLSVKVAQVQGELAPDEALVELLRYGHYAGKSQWESRYGAIVMGAAGEVCWVPLGAAAGIEKNVLTYGKAVRGELDERTLQTTLTALHNQLWMPIENALPKGVKTITVSPDSDLNFVSFATLLTPEGKFLAEKYSLRYIVSGRDLLRAVRPSTSRLMALFGNPDFGSEMKWTAPRSAVSGTAPWRAQELSEFGGISLPALPGAAAECAALKIETDNLEIPSRAFLGAEATEAQLRQIKSPRILHFATHGFFLEESNNTKTGAEPISIGAQTFGAGAEGQARQALLGNPMHRSGLALAGAQRTLEAWAKGAAPPPDDDGVVTAEEVGGLNLQGTWLVTLSACDTGAGEARAGEGVMGLRRGFIQAGAQNLLMTLWSISDETTVEIMKDFYARALKTGNAPQALADTQREWLVKLRKEKGLTPAVTLAGPFIMSSQGKP